MAQYVALLDHYGLYSVFDNSAVKLDGIQSSSLEPTNSELTSYKQTQQNRSRISISGSQFSCLVGQKDKTKPTAYQGNDRFALIHHIPNTSRIMLLVGKQETSLDEIQNIMHSLQQQNIFQPTQET
ncbi:uncharacterized protein LOC104265624 [Ciona intestinalis]